MITVPDEARAILFDCDGTLVDSLPLYLRGWLQAFRDVGGIELEASWFAGRGGLSEGQLIRAFEAEYGVSVDSTGLIVHARAAVIALMADLREMKIVADTARHYRGRLPLAVASSGSRPVVHHSLRVTGLRELFDVVVTVEDVAHPKPAPDIFLKAAEKLGVSPALCVVLEDSNEGLAAARAAGMEGIDVRPYLTSA